MIDKVRVEQIRLKIQQLRESDDDKDQDIGYIQRLVRELCDEVEGLLLEIEQL